ncbi:GNAT family N-acetyltransferase [Oscillospiraceae bacterium PP1C4]
MNIITLDQTNLDTEHICCAITEKKGESCVASKKAWMCERFAEGYVFKKADVRGKVFVEYTPAENAWCPIEAEGYLFIDCFWVSGQYKGQGYASALLEECISDAKAQNKKGLLALSSSKKMPFLSDANFYNHKGFAVCDTAPPYYELYCLRLDETAELPKFRESVKQGGIDEQGVVLYYSDHCPHNAKYVPLIQGIAEERGVPFAVHKITTKKQAQNAPAPFTTYSMFYNGKFITNEIFSDKKFVKFLEEKGL